MLKASCIIVAIYCVFLIPDIAPGFFSFLKPGHKQKVSVEGRFFCGNTPASGILVKLVDKDTVSDDKMASTRTNSDGYFSLYGKEVEIGRIEPTIKAYHTCKKGSLRCDRKWSMGVPKSYINSGKTMDIGSINLELKLPGETHDCFH